MADQDQTTQSEDLPPMVDPADQPADAPADQPAEVAPTGEGVGVGESSDPVVHQLLAERDTHTQNLAAYEADPDSDPDALQATKDRIQEIDSQLADQGYAR